MCKHKLFPITYMSLLFFQNYYCFLRSPGRDIELFSWHFFISFPRDRKLWPRVSNSLPQVNNSLPQVDNSLPQVRKLFPKVSKLFPQVSKSFPQASKSFPQVTKSFPQNSKIAKCLFYGTFLGPSKIFQYVTLDCVLFGTACLAVSPLHWILIQAMYLDAEKLVFANLWERLANLW